MFKLIDDIFLSKKYIRFFAKIQNIAVIRDRKFQTSVENGEKVARGWWSKTWI